MLQVLYIVAILLCIELGYYLVLLIQKEVRIRQYEKAVTMDLEEESVPPSVLIHQEEHDLFM